MTNVKENRGFTAEELIKELEDQRHAERVLNERLKDARKLGDLSNNPEYDQTREELSKVSTRIDEIKAILTELSGSDSENIIHFGRYPQDADGEVKPVEWQLLETDGNKALLISKYALFFKEMHHEPAFVGWKDCDLRNWMNDAEEGFMKEAFSEEERKQIMQTDHGDSKDYVFPLGEEEFRKYMEKRTKGTKPTEYAKAQGIQTYEAYGGTCIVRLRPDAFVNDDKDAVQPAMWIRLK